MWNELRGGTAESASTSNLPNVGRFVAAADPVNDSANITPSTTNVANSHNLPPITSDNIVRRGALLPNDFANLAITGTQEIIETNANAVYNSSAGLGHGTPFRYNFSDISSIHRVNDTVIVHEEYSGSNEFYAPKHNPLSLNRGRSHFYHGLPGDNAISSGWGLGQSSGESVFNHQYRIDQNDSSGLRLRGLVRDEGIVERIIGAQNSEGLWSQIPRFDPEALLNTFHNEIAAQDNSIDLFPDDLPGHPRSGLLDSESHQTSYLDRSINDLNRVSEILAGGNDSPISPISGLKSEILNALINEADQSRPRNNIVAPQNSPNDRSVINDMKRLMQCKMYWSKKFR